MSARSTNLPEANQRLLAALCEPFLSPESRPDRKTAKKVNGLFHDERDEMLDAPAVILDQRARLAHRGREVFFFRDEPEWDDILLGLLFQLEQFLIFLLPVCLACRS